MAITVVTTPGKQFASTENVTIDKLNQLGQPTFVISGTVATSDLAAGSVTAAKTTVDANNFATSSFAAGVYTLAFSPATAPTSLVNGLEVCFKASNDCTGATQINVGVGGNVTLFRNKTEALIVGDIVANQMVLCRYDSTAGVWQMQSHLSMPETWRATTAGTAPNFTVTLSPPGGTNSVTLATIAGRPIILKMHVDGVGSDNLQVTIGGAAALTSKSIRRNFNQVTAALDLRQNQETIVVYDATSDTFQMQGQVGNAPFSGGPIAAGRNIVITNNGVTPTAKMDVAADEVLLKPTGSGGPYFLATSVSLTLDIAGAVGSPLGLDTGAEASNTWYYIWLIYNGSNVSAVFSVSSTSPNLSSGSLTAYKWIALVGMTRNDNTSNFTNLVIHDRAAWTEDTNIFTAKAAAADNAWEILAGADATGFRAVVPPIAKSVSGTIGWTNTASNARIAISGCNSDGTVNTGSPLGIVYAMAVQGGAAWNTWTYGTQYSVPVRGGASYNVQWKADKPDATGRSRLNVSGFIF